MYQDPGEKLVELAENQQLINPDVTPCWGFEPGTHWWRATGRPINKFKLAFWTVHLQKYSNSCFVVKFHPVKSSSSAGEISWQLALSYIPGACALSAVPTLLST